jgi:hypothetical protein
MKSDYDKWFISTDGTETAIKCKREKFMDALIDLVGKAKASQIHSKFRRATFSENCKLELELMEG